MRSILIFVVIIIAFNSNIFSASIAFPSRSSELNNFFGLKVKYENDDSCSLVFPVDFGVYSEKERAFLVALIRNRIEQRDLDCLAPEVFYAMDHLIKITKKHQTKKLVKLVLGHNSDFFKLDGVLSANYFEYYQLPVIDAIRDIRVLNKIPLNALEDRICAWLSSSVLSKKRIARLRKNRKVFNFLRSKISCLVALPMNLESH